MQILDMAKVGYEVFLEKQSSTPGGMLFLEWDMLPMRERNAWKVIVYAILQAFLKELKADFDKIG